MQYYVELAQNPIVILISVLLVIFAAFSYVRMHVRRNALIKRVNGLNAQLKQIDENLLTVITNKKKETEALSKFMDGRGA
jgi:hypothetical protein